MPVTTEEILAGGKGPVRKTRADNPSTAEPISPPQGAPTAVNDKDSTGVENVGYDKAVSQGAPNNPKSASEVVRRGVVESRPTVERERPKKLSYVEMYERMTPYKPPSPEDVERERKKQKREAIFSAIGDGISALSNLYFTSQYAPNAYDPSQGMAATTRARFDRLKKEREANQREYMNGYLRAMQMDDAAGYKETLAQMKEREQKRREAETNISIALKQADLDYKEAKTDGQAYINELYRLKGRALEAGMGAQAELIEEKIKTEKAKQHKYFHGGSGSGGGATKKYPVFDKNGDVVDHVYTPEEAVSETERNGGTYPGQQREQQQEQQQGHRKKKTTSTSTTTTPTAGREPRKNKKPNPMSYSDTSNGGGGKQKKKNPMS